MESLQILTSALHHQRIMSMCNVTDALLILLTFHDVFELILKTIWLFCIPELPIGPFYRRLAFRKHRRCLIHPSLK